MPYIWISSYSGPPSTITVCDFVTQTICYTSPTQITNIGPFPYIINLPSPDFDSVYKISLSAQSDNGCLIVETDTCSTLPTPTPSSLPDCSYILFDTNNNFVTSGTVDYLDCYGVQGTYTATTTGLFGLCVVSASTSVEIDIVDDSSYDCTYFEGTWYAPNIPTPTQTPSNPPTPTPSPSDVLYVYETISFPYSFATTQSGRNVKIKIGGMNSFINAPLRITAGSSVILGSYSGNPAYYTIPVTGTSGTIVVSAATTTLGQVDSIDFIEVESPTPSVNNIPITATTEELSKLTSVEVLRMNSKVWCTGNIQLLSGLTSMTSILLNEGNYTGDIQHLPDSIQDLSLGSSSFKSTNTVFGNIGTLPSSIRSMQIYGLNTISGNVSSLSSLFTSSSQFSKFFLNGHNTITGDMSYLPNVWYIGINDEPAVGSYLTSFTGNTLSGNLVLKSALREIKIGGGNVITGNLSATTIPSTSNFAIFDIAGNNTIGGSVSLLKLPKTWFRLLGDNVVSGDIGTIINIGSNPLIEYIEFRNKGQLGLIANVAVVTSGNTLSGNISSLQSCVSLESIIFGGNNTLTGDLSSLLTINTNQLKGLYIVSQNNTINNANFDISDNDIVVNNPYISLVTNNTGNGMNSTQVNNLLKYLDAKCTTTLNLPNSIKILGTGHSAPTGDGLVAKTNLINKNFGITTN
jgi:hypothetical protein